MTEAAQITERAHKIIDQLPTFAEVSGCMDCSILFRRGHACPFCGSESVVNLADVLNRESN